MSKKEFKLVFSDGSEIGDWPVAVKHTQEFNIGSEIAESSLVVDPIFNSSLQSNLYGRIMTLVEATTDSYKLQAVKDLFAKELSSWSSDVFSSAREIAEGGGSSSNLYTRGSRNI